MSWAPISGKTKVEHTFRIIKCQFGYKKTVYRGLRKNKYRLYLHQFRNVVMTQHMAFYTDAAVASMVECGIRGIWEMANGIPCETELNR